MVASLKPANSNMQKLSVPTPYLVGDVKVYTFEVDGKLILFDTGPPTDDARQFLKDNVDLDRLKYVFITHWHPEHCGLAAFLEKETTAEIIISKYEAEKLSHPERHALQMNNLLPSLGFDEDEVEKQREVARWLETIAPTPENYRVLEESQDVLDALGLSYFYSPWHGGCDVVYMLQNYAISGDTVLKGIFSCPCIEVDPDDPSAGRFSNYAALCEAISQLKKIENYSFLPSHRDPVESVDDWIEFFVTKLVERTRALAPLLQSGNTVYQSTVKFFGKRVEKPFHLYIKASEVALCHDFLNAPEQLIQALEKNDLLDRLTHLIGQEWLNQSL
jgi:hydroxyacylglutathione hydrolase